MKKSDLKNGMRVRFQGRDCCHIVFDDIIVNSEERLFCNLSNYEENMVGRGGGGKFDIIEVYKAPDKGYMLDGTKKGELIWKREEEKEMTVAEISKELGYKVKIIE